ncbi:geranylgeranyl reductase [Chloroherpeton thalassium ATCC 35110]|uniref:Geranylgeranyl diphosphate reductase n=1 Tax=Chloroherpeton thalassium (strain ATCC 35110 / GB-78) TaxID=517418 RepID=B3QZ41_CHLT3|nr:geranylgeranyl diphosphate reductase [Chloroherpeton thalassium]ACF13734.1 geranylgeranyl reductase [Chloroherpeton thalassium ATCC 35110]
MKCDVAIIGGGPSGAAAAHELAKAGISNVLIERNFNNTKPCGGAIPLGLIEEFAIPDEIVERKVDHMAVRSPKGRVIEMHMPTGFVGMVRRERFDRFLRERAAADGTELLEAKMRKVRKTNGVYQISVDAASKGVSEIEAKYVIGADGANSKVANELGFPPNEYKAIAIQERFHYSPALERYNNLVEIWFDGEVSPDFYGWIFPKADHVAIGTGTDDKHGNIRKLQARFREKIGLDIEPYLEEAAKLPMHPRKSFTQESAMLVGDAAGLVTPSNGEGIFFAMRSGKMAGQTLANFINGQEKSLHAYEANFHKLYKIIFKGLGMMQSVYYRNDRLRESFVAICRDEHVQQITFDSYLYKKMVPAPFWVQMKIMAKNIYHLALGG